MVQPQLKDCPRQNASSVPRMANRIAPIRELAWRISQYSAAHSTYRKQDGTLCTSSSSTAQQIALAQHHTLAQDLACTQLAPNTTFRSAHASSKVAPYARSAPSSTRADRSIRDASAARRSARAEQVRAEAHLARLPCPPTACLLPAPRRPDARTRGGSEESAAC